MKTHIEQLKKDIKQEIMKDMEHLIGIITESLDVKFGLFAERMEAGFAHVDHEMKEMKRELKQDIYWTHEAIKSVKNDVMRVEKRLDGVEVRLGCVETQLGSMQTELQSVQADLRSINGQIAKISDLKPH